jgi:WD40 repeat protein
MIASVEELGNILIFNNSGAQPTIADTIKTGTSYAFAADFSPANDRIAVGASSGKLNIYALPGGALVKSVTAHPNFVFSVNYSPDGTMIGSGGTDNKAKIWDANGTLKFTLTGHTHDVTSVQFTPDNAYLVTAGNDGNIKIWSTADGSLVRNIMAHNDDIRQIDISADGKKIVSASNDESCKIWSLETGEWLATFGNANGGIIWSAAWAPDGNSIVTGTGKGDVILWDVSGISATHDMSGIMEKVSVFPNPAAEYLEVMPAPGVELIYAALLDLDGKLLRMLDPGMGRFIISDLPPGILHLQLQTKDGKKGIIPFIKN